MVKKTFISIITNELNLFIRLSKKVSSSHPYIVIILMHEYFRTIYPYDPFIKKRYSNKNEENILLCLKNNNFILNSFSNVGSYFSSNKMINNYLSDFEIDKKQSTQKLFGKLWKERMKNNFLDSRKVLLDSFIKNNFDLNFLKGKNVLDMGCGSGRFTLALASMGVKKAVGVDLGSEGIEIAKRNAKINNIKNARFIRASVLDLPFKDESFDFVFCKGVLHHTGNFNKGMQEYYRVMTKNGKGFLYLYGNGGIFWNSRKKMREVMKSIPVEYTMKILDLIGMPSKRTIFVDSWYVPIEEHMKSRSVEKLMYKLGFKDIKRWKKGRKIELESIVYSNNKFAKELWGEGELRYIVKK